MLTSQRVVDVILKAFDVCAASQGCMNNVTIGDDRFGYYETVAGGSGAGPTWYDFSLYKFVREFLFFNSFWNLSTLLGMEQAAFTRI